jgi:hypothetical protein
MKTKILRTVAVTSLGLAIIFGAAWQAQTQDAKAPYPTMAPLEQYLIADQNAEIFLARSAAMESVSRDAEVLVLGRHGYETAVKGKNGFVCLVQRSWTADIDDPDFWNPKLRAPICFNPAAARSYLPLEIKKTELVLAGQSKAQMFESIKVGLDKKELPTPESGAMCYMLSKQGYLSDRDGHWHPHLMFFLPQTDPQTWGANLPNSPILAGEDPQDRLTVFLVPVAKWSDGTADSPNQH